MMYELQLRTDNGAFVIWNSNDVREVFGLIIEHGDNLLVVPLG